MTKRCTRPSVGQGRREVSLHVACDRKGKCDLTLLEGGGGYIEVEGGSPREIVQMIEKLQHDPSLRVRPIYPDDLPAIVRHMAKKRGLIASPFVIATERACADDADWFRRNPRAVHRTRTLFPGEMEGTFEGGDVRVLVTQIAPGIRIRRFGYVGGQVQ